LSQFLCLFDLERSTYSRTQKYRGDWPPDFTQAISFVAVASEVQQPTLVICPPSSADDGLGAG